MNRLADLDPGDAAVEARRDAEATQRSLGQFAVHVLVGTALAFVCIYAGRRHRLSIDGMLLARLAIGYLIAVVMHESGHAAAAMTQGFRICSFGVWPLRFYKDGRSWRAGWLERKGPKGFIAITATTGERLRLREFLVVAAGPVTSLAVALGCWIAASGADGQPKRVVDQLLIVALWSMVAAAGGLLPIRSGAALSDAARLQTLIAGGAECDRTIAQQMIIAAAVSGTRPRDWPAELIEMAASEDDRTGRTLRYNWLVDHGRIDEAERELVWLLTQAWREEFVCTWRLQAAWFLAFYRGDAVTARRWFDAARGGRGCGFRIAEAALASVEGRRVDALQLIPEALRECEELDDRGTAVAIRDALELLKERTKGERFVS